MLTGLFLIWILIGSAFMVLMLMFTLFNTTTNATFKIASSFREAKKAKAEQEQLAILKEIAAKQGIELPEEPGKPESMSAKAKSFFIEDKGEELREQLLGIKPIPKGMSEEEKNIRKHLGITGEQTH